jgi:Holliday junction DNA helicase RuvA
MMFDYLRGKLVHAEAEFIVLDVGGVGYRIFCANPHAMGAPDGRETTVYVHHHVREDAITLFGFATRGEQSLFRRLIEVSGVGPKVALAAMSGGRPESLIGAILREDVAYLTRLPGIGKKTAQRIILDLKDKLGTAADDAGNTAFAAAGAALEENAAADAAAREIREGLSALGFTAAEIDRVWPVVRRGLGAGETADAVMKVALKHLYKG